MGNSLIACAIFCQTVASEQLDQQGERQLLINGKVESDVKNRPWIVVAGQEIKQVCGGTILGKNIIMTAAHCCKAGASFSVGYSVNVGSVQYKTGTADQRLKITKTEAHPGSDGTASGADICLVRVSPDIKFNDKVQPAALPSGSTPLGTSVLVFGFGVVRVGVANTASETLLRWGSAKAVKCDTKDPKNHLDKLLCLQDATTTICQGDSGTGSIIESGGKQVVVGVVSGASGVGGPCQAGTPVWYASVFLNLDWIKKTAAGLGSLGTETGSGGSAGIPGTTSPGTTSDGTATSGGTSSSPGSSNNPTTPPPSQGIPDTSQPPVSEAKSSMSPELLIGLVVGGLALVGLLVALAYFGCYKKGSSSDVPIPEHVRKYNNHQGPDRRHKNTNRRNSQQRGNRDQRGNSLRRR